eukprot:c12826_g1_i1.p1 GENE.c12826_g1_i1~~c12826_g1_i1.p1  ORF type:complete len:270 (+),score=48.87 c12826_g1_i1:3-812(+)
MRVTRRDSHPESNPPTNIAPVVIPSTASPHYNKSMPFRNSKETAAAKAKQESSVESPEPFTKLAPCVICKKMIFPSQAPNAVSLTDELNYHFNCFKCMACHCNFEDGQITVVNMMPYHARCTAKAAPVCLFCHGIVSDEAVDWKGMPVHVGCFACNICSKSLVNEAYLEVANSLVCPTCATCKSCGKVLSGSRCVVDNGFTYHPECFSVSSLCEECHEPIRDKKMFVIEDRRWHERCMRCSVCKKVFNDNTPVALVNGQPRHQRCVGHS